VLWDGDQASLARVSAKCYNSSVIHCNLRSTDVIFLPGGERDVLDGGSVRTNRVWQMGAVQSLAGVARGMLGIKM
jgi:hypothetical protein